MIKKIRSVSRRKVLTAAAGLAAASIPAVFRPAIAVPEAVKIGLVGPKTGPFALFYEEMSYAIEHFKKATETRFRSTAPCIPLEFVVKDSQSNPNRASEVDTGTDPQGQGSHRHRHSPRPRRSIRFPISANSTACRASPTMIRLMPFSSVGNGDPKKGFEWTYNFFFDGAGRLGSRSLEAWARVKTNKISACYGQMTSTARIFAQVCRRR